MIYIITVYKPCKTTLQQAGPMTVFRQQWTELRARGLTNPNPRKQFDKDLLAFLQSIHQQGHRMILLGDLNETTNNSKLIQQFKKYGLYDMIKDRHDNLPNFRSCLKGGNTIDYAFCSISIPRSVTASTYEPFYLHSNSDHRGIVIDLNRHTLFDRPQVLVAAPQRGVMSTNHIQSETFLKHLTQYW